MLQIYVTLWGRWFVCVYVRACVRVCVWVYLELLSHFLPIKINLINMSPILIKIVDFKNLAWATSFATWAGRKFIYLQGKWKKKLLSYPDLSRSTQSTSHQFLLSNSLKTAKTLTATIYITYSYTSSKQCTFSTNSSSTSGKIQGDSQKFLDRLFWVINIIKWAPYIPITAKIHNKRFFHIFLSLSVRVGACCPSTFDVVSL